MRLSRWIVLAPIALFGAVACGSITLPKEGATGGTGGGGGGGGSGAGAGAGFDECDVPSDCILRPASCCGSCGQPTREDVVAIAQDQQGAYSESVCPDDVGCPACAAPNDPTLLATCSNGSCEVVDVLTNAVTECTSSAECRIRTTACCECGGPTDFEHLVAIHVSQEAAYAALVCSPTDTCAECAPNYPPDVVAECSDGRCNAFILE